MTASPWDDEFWAIVRGAEDPEPNIHPARARLREIIRDAGPGGIRIRNAWERLDTENLTVMRETVQRWFALDQAAGLIIKDGNGWKWAGP